MKLAKKILAVLLAVVLVGAVFAGCSSNGSKDNSKDNSASDSAKKSDLTVGFIFLHDENSTYDKNFITAAEEACKKEGVKILKKTNIPEGQECYDAAAELVDEGANIVFADSFGHQDYLLQAAKKFKDVQFLHATGTKAHTEKLSNYHNAFASIYEGRYLAGVAAGMKLNEMIASKKITADKAKMGYVGAFTYAEVISGYTSFYLGAKSVCPSVTMDVTFTGMMKLQKKKQQINLSRTVAFSSASTLTQWALRQLAKQQAFPMYHTTAQQFQLVLTHSSFLQESIGLLTSSTQLSA